MAQCRCGKRRYDKLGAVIALAEIQRKDRPGAQERRAYRCPSVPSLWHLTKQPQRPGRSRA